MATIGIVGGGVAGLHLALLLQRHGVPVTLYTELAPAERRASRLPNLAARLATVRGYERLLGVDHWPDCNLYGIDVTVTGEPPLTFRAGFERPGSFVDMRIYLATLLEDFAARGGDVVVGTLERRDVVRLSDRHDLMVIGSGRGSLSELFPRVAKHSPYTTPQRVLCAGLFHGISNPAPDHLSFTIVPGQGEIFQAPFHSFDGPVSAILFEGVPGQIWEPLLRQRPENDPQRFNQTMLGLLRQYAPHIYERVEPRTFGLARPQDLLQGAITPTVRQSYTDLGNGTFAVAIGDAHVVNDPLLGQGANLAAHSAWLLGQAILEDVVFDEWFCRRAAERIWPRAEAASAWNNAMLQPPAPHMIDFMVAAAQHPSIANDYANNFDHPQRNWNILATPERTATYLRQVGVAAPPTRSAT